MSPRAPRAVRSAAPAAGSPFDEGDAASLTRSGVRHPGRVALGVLIVAAVGVLAYAFVPRLPDSVVLAALAVALFVFCRLTSRTHPWS